MASEILDPTVTRAAVRLLVDLYIGSRAGNLTQEDYLHTSSSGSTRRRQWERDGLNGHALNSTEKRRAAFLENSFEQLSRAVQALRYGSGSGSGTGTDSADSDVTAVSGMLVFTRDSQDDLAGQAGQAHEQTTVHATSQAVAWSNAHCSVESSSGIAPGKHSSYNLSASKKVFRFVMLLRCFVDRLGIVCFSEDAGNNPAMGSGKASNDQTARVSIEVTMGSGGVSGHVPSKTEVADAITPIDLLPPTPVLPSASTPAGSDRSSDVASSKTGGPTSSSRQRVTDATHTFVEILDALGVGFVSSPALPNIGMSKRSESVVWGHMRFTFPECPLDSFVDCSTGYSSSSGPTPVSSPSAFVDSNTRKEAVTKLLGRYLGQHSRCQDQLLDILDGYLTFEAYSPHSSKNEECRPEVTSCPVDTGGIDPSEHLTVEFSVQSDGSTGPFPAAAGAQIEVGERSNGRGDGRGDGQGDGLGDGLGDGRGDGQGDGRGDGQGDGLGDGRGEMAGGIVEKADATAAQLVPAVWQILQALPTPPSLVQRVRSLGGASAGSIRSLFDINSKFRLLYTLQIVDSMLLLPGTSASTNRNSSLQHDLGITDTDSAKWAVHFIDIGGAEYLLEILLQLISCGIRTSFLPTGTAEKQSALPPNGYPELCDGTPNPSIAPARNSHLPQMSSRDDVGILTVSILLRILHKLLLRDPEYSANWSSGTLTVSTDSVFASETGSSSWLQPLLTASDAPQGSSSVPPGLVLAFVDTRALLCDLLSFCCTVLSSTPIDTLAAATAAASGNSNTDLRGNGMPGVEMRPKSNVETGVETAIEKAVPRVLQALVEHTLLLTFGLSAVGVAAVDRDSMDGCTDSSQCSQYVLKSLSPGLFQRFLSATCLCKHACVRRAACHGILEGLAACRVSGLKSNMYVHRFWLEHLLCTVGMRVDADSPDAHAVRAIPSMIIANTRHIEHVSSLIAALVSLRSSVAAPVAAAVPGSSQPAARVVISGGGRDSSSGSDGNRDSSGTGNRDSSGSDGNRDNSQTTIDSESDTLSYVNIFLGFKSILARVLCSQQDTEHSQPGHSDMIRLGKRSTRSTNSADCHQSNSLFPLDPSATTNSSLVLNDTGAGHVERALVGVLRVMSALAHTSSEMRNLMGKQSNIAAGPGVTVCEQEKSDNSTAGLASTDSSDSLQLVDFLYANCLFPLRVSSGCSDCAKPHTEPLALSPSTRRLAYHLLLQLCAANKDNLSRLCVVMWNEAAAAAKEATERVREGSKTSASASTCDSSTMNAIRGEKESGMRADCAVSAQAMLPTPRWNYDPSTLTKSENTSYVGLVNQGATCYMNSFLQQLFHVSAFSRGLLAINKQVSGQAEEVSSDDDQVLFQLQVLFGYLQLSEKKIYDTMPFCSALKDYDGSAIKVSEQKDINEFASSLFDTLEHNKKCAALLKKTFQGKLVYTIQSTETSYR